ncbi:hypothetical protein Rhe02_38080 [Rhizocola hellebori]|uniref:Uncharacterized protein n=1 Tax=Rhizocola hellebori TaxID=1392758 RepID=A0A8J3VH75_9ACTN|nr:hypothetical protein [Rhizocola hellebori]GIH05741.1 hypothetical protein Rhe02_38080 [Rhizocola hellebori]
MEFGGDARHAWLEEMSHQLLLLSAMTLRNFKEVDELLEKATRLEPTVQDRPA